MKENNQERQSNFCMKCNLRERQNQDNPLCIVCLKKWDKVLIDTRVYEQPQKFQTIPPKQQIQYRYNLYFALYCKNMSFTNNVHIQNKQDFDLMMARNKNKKKLINVEKNEFYSKLNLQSTGTYGCVDVKYDPFIGFHAISRGYIPKGTFICHTAGDLVILEQITTDDNLSHLKINKNNELGITCEQRGNISAFILGPKFQKVDFQNFKTRKKLIYRVQYANLELKQVVLDDILYLCFYTKCDIYENQLLLTGQTGFATLRLNHSIDELQKHMGKQKFSYIKQ